MSTNSIGNTKNLPPPGEHKAQCSGSTCLTSKYCKPNQKLTKKNIAVMQQFAHVSKHAILTGEVVITTTYYHTVNGTCRGCCCC